MLIGQALLCYLKFDQEVAKIITKHPLFFQLHKLYLCFSNIF